MGDGDDRNRTNHWIMYGLPAATVVAILAAGRPYIIQ